jgi:hypothetical protein
MMQLIDPWPRMMRFALAVLNELRLRMRGAGGPVLRRLCLPLRGSERATRLPTSIPYGGA